MSSSCKDLSATGGQRASAQRNAWRLVMIAVLFALLGTATTALALQPEDILLIANQNDPNSLALAQYYQEKRLIPAANLLLVRMGSKEDCSRTEYLQHLVTPLREFLAKRGEQAQIKSLLLFYGLPLRVAAPELADEQAYQLNALRGEKEQLDRQLKSPSELTDTQRQLLAAKVQQLNMQLEHARQKGQGAAVDSELALALIDNYPLQGWLANPYFIGFQNQKQKQPLGIGKQQVLLVARLDGPTVEIARRLIDDSLQAEKKGLQGNAYFDARWPQPKQQSGLSGYALYDNSLHRAAELSRKLSRLPVVLDQQERLFQPGEAPQAALYSGWYSVAKYVPAFAWQIGAVAYHIASAECTTLKKPGSKVWCKRLLEEGVAATVGPVAEPYVSGFPLPDLFFGYLLDGYYSLAESYFLSLPYLSWQMVLIGDPLYRPFRNRLKPVQ